MNRPDLLNIDARESSHRQRLEWRIQRIFLIFLYAAILAVVLGAVGEGVLSHASLGMPSGPLQLEYERFLRYRSAEDLHIRIHHGAPLHALVSAKTTSGTSVCSDLHYLARPVTRRAYDGKLFAEGEHRNESMMRNESVSRIAVSELLLFEKEG